MGRCESNAGEKVYFYINRMTDGEGKILAQDNESWEVVAGELTKDEKIPEI